MLFSTKERDFSIELDCHGFRYYDPVLGKYSTLDPIQDGLNHYVYVGNNPINAIDPLGLFTLFGKKYVMPWHPKANLNPMKSVFATAPKQVAGQALAVATTGSTVNMADADTVTDGFNSGLKTGGKAVINATSKTVVSTATLGIKDGGDLITVTDEDRASGYGLSEGLARGGTEILMGVATGGLSRTSKAGKVVLAMDVGAAGVGTTTAAMEIREKGLNLANGGNVALQLLSLAANFVGIRGNKVDDVKAPQTTTDGLGNSVPMDEYGIPDSSLFNPKPGIDRYKRPFGTTQAQRDAVQGQPSVVTGKVEDKMIADHKDPLVVEHYRTGTNSDAQKSVEAVQPHTRADSQEQAKRARAFSMEMRKKLEEQNGN